MFEAVDTTTARDSTGVSVEIVDEGLRYRSRDGNFLFVPLEYVYGENAVVVYESSIRTWEVPNALAAIPTIERQGILQEITAALDALGIAHRVAS